MEAIKNKLLGSTAQPTKPKGESRAEAEVERKNQGNRPGAVAQKKPRDARADNAQHEQHQRHGDHGGDDDDSERRPKRYLRKKAIAARYGNIHERSIARMVGDGRLPPPDLYNGRFPLWSEDMLDRHDRKATQALARREARREHADAADPK
jgi:hypothetical protein